MSIKNVLNVKEGTLIKGLSIEKLGSITISTTGWNFKQKRIVRNIWSSEERDRFSFCFCPDFKVLEQIEKNKIKKHDGKIMYKDIKKNGKCFERDIKPWFKAGILEKGNCLGMSLGENFVALRPSHDDIYRPDFYEVFLFHRILNGDNIQWIVLQTKSLHKKLVTLQTYSELLNAPIELL